MKAIRITKNGDASVLELQDLPQPKPGPGEALVRLKAAGLNFIDIYIRSGRYARPLPHTPGLEGAGIVEAIGDGVTEVVVGDRVAYAGTMGSYAEFNLIKAANLIPLPNEITFEQGAAFPLQGMTAHYLLHEYYPIKKGDHVLVHAAAGGVGLLLVQWLKYWGATIIGTVSTETKANIAREAGATHLIRYTEQDFVEQTKALTDGKGADYIIDGVGKSTFDHDLEAVRYRGTICLFGSSSGPANPLAPNSLQTKSITLCGGSLFNYLNTREELLKRANDVLQGLREGWLKLKIDHVFPLEHAIQAQQLLEGRQSTGKVILKIGD
ncbi:MAG: NADPH:quinone reductase [Gammaproteobacteria bacterium 39-13]|nr:quinone oxidoreductase [Gammaproteobacteria bacterium]OJV96654.1 MAG: NADPH:quinone reductase [Gammaproteobacteria bacterium 39-13]